MQDHHSFPFLAFFDVAKLAVSQPGPWTMSEAKLEDNWPLLGKDLLRGTDRMRKDRSRQASLPGQIALQQWVMQNLCKALLSPLQGYDLLIELLGKRVPRCGLQGRQNRDSALWPSEAVAAVATAAAPRNIRQDLRGSQGACRLKRISSCNHSVASSCRSMAFGRDLQCVKLKIELIKLVRWGVHYPCKAFKNLPGGESTLTIIRPAHSCRRGNSSEGSSAVSIKVISALISAALWKTAFRAFTTFWMSLASLNPNRISNGFLFERENDNEWFISGSLCLGR